MYVIGKLDSTLLLCLPLSHVSLWFVRRGSWQGVAESKSALFHINMVTACCLLYTNKVWTQCLCPEESDTKFFIKQKRIHHWFLPGGNEYPLLAALTTSADRVRRYFPLGIWSSFVWSGFRQAEAFRTCGHLGEVYCSQDTRVFQWWILGTNSKEHGWTLLNRKRLVSFKTMLQLLVCVCVYYSFYYPSQSASPVIFIFINCNAKTNSILFVQHIVASFSF